MELKIRRRERIDSSPAVGLSQTWVEYQIIEGRKIIARCGSLDAAERQIAKLNYVADKTE